MALAAPCSSFRLVPGWSNLLPGQPGGLLWTSSLNTCTMRWLQINSLASDDRLELRIYTL